MRASVFLTALAIVASSSEPVGAAEFTTTFVDVITETIEESSSTGGALNESITMEPGTVASTESFVGNTSMYLTSSLNTTTSEAYMAPVSWQAPSSSSHLVVIVQEGAANAQSGSTVACMLVAGLSILLV